jgi:hypothetical protein
MMIRTMIAVIGRRRYWHHLWYCSRQRHGLRKGAGRVFRAEKVKLRDDRVVCWRRRRSMRGLGSHRQHKSTITEITSNARETRR